MPLIWRFTLAPGAAGGAGAGAHAQPAVRIVPDGDQVAALHEKRRGGTEGATASFNQSKRRAAQNTSLG